MNLLDLIFPKTCVNCGGVGKYICEDCQKLIQKVEFQICPVCTRPSISGLTHPKCETKRSLDGLHSFVYYSPPIPQALYKLKYKFVRDLATQLVDSLEPELPPVLQDFYLTPIPLHLTRQNWRDFNQSEILAGLLAKKFGLSLKADLLKRKKATKSQVGLSRKGREENVKGVFECIDRDFVEGGSFIVFDDVWTSGATLKNAAAALKRAGAIEVWGLTLARSR